MGFEKRVRQICLAFNIVAAALLFVLMVLGAADVIGRTLFNAPISGAAETGPVLLALMVFLSWGYSQIRKDHVNVEMFINYFPKRLKHLTNLFTTLLSLFLFILIVWQSFVYALETFKTGERVYVVGWPLAPFQLFVPLGGLFLCLVLILDVFRLVYQLKRRD